MRVLVDELRASHLRLEQFAGLLLSGTAAATADCWMSAMAVFRPEALRLLAQSLELRLRCHSCSGPVLQRMSRRDAQHNVTSRTAGGAQLTRDFNRLMRHLASNVTGLGRPLKRSFSDQVLRGEGTSGPPPLPVRLGVFSVHEGRVCQVAEEPNAVGNTRVRFLADGTLSDWLPADSLQPVVANASD